MDTSAPAWAALRVLQRTPAIRTRSASIDTDASTPSESRASPTTRSGTTVSGVVPDRSRLHALTASVGSLPVSQCPMSLVVQPKPHTPHR